ncbi:hypothetical protein J4403_03220 [Candidatus Woesearchaeota archaeon]|nr:hypothetical protein [Candidatus Woesearchaeota archaeon]
MEGINRSLLGGIGRFVRGLNRPQKLNSQSVTLEDILYGSPYLTKEQILRKGVVKKFNKACFNLYVHGIEDPIVHNYSDKKDPAIKKLPQSAIYDIQNGFYIDINTWQVYYDLESVPKHLYSFKDQLDFAEGIFDHEIMHYIVYPRSRADEIIYLATISEELSKVKQIENNFELIKGYTHFVSNIFGDFLGDSYLFSGKYGAINTRPLASMRYRSTVREILTGTKEISPFLKVILNSYEQIWNTNFGLEEVKLRIKEKETIAKITNLLDENTWMNKSSWEEKLKDFTNIIKDYIFQVIPLQQAMQIINSMTDQSDEGSEDNENLSGSGSSKPGKGKSKRERNSIENLLRSLSDNSDKDSSSSQSSKSSNGKNSGGQKENSNGGAEKGSGSESDQGEGQNSGEGDYSGRDYDSRTELSKEVTKLWGNPFQSKLDFGKKRKNQGLEKALGSAYERFKNNPKKFAGAMSSLTSLDLDDCLRYLYRARAQEYLIEFKSEVKRKSNKKTILTRTNWNPSDTIGGKRGLKIIDSLIAHGQIIPYINTKKNKLRNLPGPKKNNSIADLLLVIDSSGSMGFDPYNEEPDNRGDYDSAVLAGEAQALYALDCGAMVSVINFSGGDDLAFCSYTYKLDNIERVLLNKQDGGTMFPCKEIAKMMTLTKNKLFVSILSDCELYNTAEAIESMMDELTEFDKFSVFQTSRWGGLTSFARELKSHGANLFVVRTHKDLKNIVVGETMREYDLEFDGEEDEQII